MNLLFLGILMSSRFASWPIPFLEWWVATRVLSPKYVPDWMQTCLTSVGERYFKQHIWNKEGVFEKKSTSWSCPNCTQRKDLPLYKISRATALVWPKPVLSRWQRQQAARLKARRWKRWKAARVRRWRLLFIGVLVLRFWVRPQKSGHPGLYRKTYLWRVDVSDRVPILTWIIAFEYEMSSGILNSDMNMIQDLSEMLNKWIICVLFYALVRKNRLCPFCT